MIIPSLFFSPQDERMRQKNPMAIIEKKGMVVLSFFITTLFLRFFDRKNLIDPDVLKYLKFA
jgi:hypothetical protein